MRRLALILTPALGLPPLTTVSAQSPTPAATAPAAEAPTAEQLAQARTLFVAGSKAYGERRYEVAIEAFEAAFDLAPRASIVFALAQANRLQYFVDGKFERIEKAVEYYRQYLERDDADPAQSELAVRHLSSLNPQLARLSRKQDASIARIIVSSDTPGARVRIGDAPLQEVPAAFEVAPGPLQITVEAEGHGAQTREVVAVGGTGLPIDVQLTPLPGKLEVRTDDGAEVLIDGRSLGVAPIAVQELPPGNHRVVVLASGRRPYVGMVELAPTRSLQLQADLEQTPQRVAAWATFGLAGALAVTGAITGTLAYQAEQEAQDFATAWREAGLAPDEVDDYNAWVSERDTWSNYTLWLGVGTGVAAALGAALWLLDNPQAPSQPLLTPSVAPGGSGAGLWGTFSF